MFNAIIIGLSQGLLFAWPSVALAAAYRLLKFPDLSIEGAFLVGAGCFAYASKCSLPLVLCFAVGGLSSAVVGGLTALLHARLRINKFMAGILVTAVCYSLCLRLLNAPNVSLLNQRSLFDWASTIFGVTLDTQDSFGVWLFLVTSISFAGVILLKLAESHKGLIVRASALGGVNALNVRMRQVRGLGIGLAVTGAVAGLGGCLVVSRQGFYDINMNQGVVITALATISIGESLLPQSWPFALRTLVGALVGSLIYQVIIALALRFGAHPADLRLFTTALVLIVLVAQRGRNTSLIEDT